MTMSWRWTTMLVLPLAACSGRGGGNGADVAPVAAERRPDVAGDAAAGPPAPRQAPTPAARPAVVRPADLSDDAGPDVVVGRYVAAIAARRYDEAWALWEHKGAASGMTATAFAASFARYASFDAAVGVPYDEDAGAGQRYVTVPVTVTGTLTSGGPFRLAGPVVLHRVARDIETDEPDAYAWRIRSSEMKPRPPADDPSKP